MGEPIFIDILPKVLWKKIYEREYGVQYSEVAVSLLANAGYHFPKISTTQIVIPSTGATAFFIDAQSWVELVEGLNETYTNNLKNLESYEKQFLLDGQEYLHIAKEISKMPLSTFSNDQLLSTFLVHQEKRYRYSTFAWSAFILNNYVADRAAEIIDSYLQKCKKEAQKQDVLESLFSPHKRAAILELQYQVEKYHGNVPPERLDELYNKFKWLSCLDIHNTSWTKEEFIKQIAPFASDVRKHIVPFEKYITEFSFEEKDLEYLHMAKRFVYIKDARDDFRRESVYYATALFEEIARRMNISTEDTSYLQEKEIIDFLSNNIKVDQDIISQRRKGFIIYLDKNKKTVCVQGDEIDNVLKSYNLFQEEEKNIEITGRVASQGKTKGVVTIVNGVNDLEKVKQGQVLVAVTTHPDFVSAMRKVVAIITDEGGITSHAAIVSREFGVPCIVGCKNATKLLRDGDFIEVDAIEGKVTKIR